MKEIKLNQGSIALVDDDDFELVSQSNWQYNKGYARTTRKGKTFAMHRLIMGVQDKDVFIDHIDGNRLNNQKSNLRTCTKIQNEWNRKVTSKLGYKGIEKMKYGRWGARIRISGIKKFLGTFATPEEAAHAYDKAAKENFGEFARLNFPPRTYQSHTDGR